MAASALALGRQLTPVPRPKENGGCGNRRPPLARHPMYGGVALSALGFALLTSPWALLPAFATLPYFDLKRRREEAWLLGAPSGIRSIPGQGPGESSPSSIEEAVDPDELAFLDAPLEDFEIPARQASLPIGIL